MSQLPANLPLEGIQDLFERDQRDTGSAIDIHYYVGLIWRRRWFLIIPFCFAMLAGIYQAITLPRMYRTETLIFVEPQQVPDNYVQAIVSAELDVRLNNIVEMIQSRTNLLNIMEQNKLFRGPKFENMFLEEKIELMRERTVVELKSDRRRRGPSNMFTISFTGDDPQKVMNVVNAMASLVIDQNLKVRESQAINTTAFLDDELSKMRTRLEKVEVALKDFRKIHMGELPDQLASNILVLDRLQQQLSEKQQSLRDEKNRLIALDNQIQQASVSVPAAAVTAPDGTEPTTAEELRQELADYQSRYTPKHPDVIRLKRRIQELDGEAPAAVSRPARLSQGRSLAAELTIQRDGVDRELAAIKQEISFLQSQIALYQQRVENTPKIEQELLSLKRDYDNIQENYKSLLDRKLEADIAVNMERRQQGEQFRILDRGRLPDKPISPNMRKLFMLCVAAGLGLGGGLIFFAGVSRQFRPQTRKCPGQAGHPRAGRHAVH